MEKWEKTKIMTFASGLTIHRGTHEIGGSCVELRAGEDKLILDLGLPLMTKTGKPFDSSPLRSRTSEELVKEGILPDIPGLYPHNRDKGSVRGVLLSHAHMDHYGLLNYIAPDIPVWAGKATHALLCAAIPFLPSTPDIKAPEDFEKEQAFVLGPFTVVPYLMDHSAVDAYAFHITCGPKSVFYSGDFREGGWKTYALGRIKETLGGKVNILLLEGTLVGRKEDARFNSEEEVAREMERLFRAYEGKPVLVYASGQNVDRICSVVKAANRTKRDIIVDLYTGSILLAIAKSQEKMTIPCPKSDDKAAMGVWFTDKTAGAVNRRNSDYHAPEACEHAKIKPEELERMLPNSVILVRPSMLADLVKVDGMKDGLLVYSLWAGYKENSDTKKFLNSLIGCGFSCQDVHFSGHANEATLKKLCDIVDPTTIIPIHTLHPDKYADLFPNRPITRLSDHEEYAFP